MSKRGAGEIPRRGDQCHVHVTNDIGWGGQGNSQQGRAAVAPPPVPTPLVIKVTKSKPGQGPWSSHSTGTNSGGDGFTRQEEKHRREGGRCSQLHESTGKEPNSRGAGASRALWRSEPGLPPDLPPSPDELSMPTQRSPTSCPSGSLERERGEKEVIGDEGQD